MKIYFSFLVILFCGCSILTKQSTYRAQAPATSQCKNPSWRGEGESQIISIKDAKLELMNTTTSASRFSFMGPPPLPILPIFFLGNYKVAFDLYIQGGKQSIKLPSLTLTVNGQTYEPTWSDLRGRPTTKPLHISPNQDEGYKISFFIEQLPKEITVNFDEYTLTYKQEMNWHYSPLVFQETGLPPYYVSCR